MGWAKGMPDTGWDGGDMPDLDTAHLLRGTGQFAADIQTDGMLHMQILRSPVAHADLLSIEAAVARRCAGVVAVLTARDLPSLGDFPVNPVLPLAFTPSFPLLARTRTEAIGQPIAAVLATSPEAAEHAIDRITPDYRETKATPPRRLAEKRWRTGDANTALATSDIVVEAQVSHPLLAPSPMEPRGIAVAYDAVTQSVTIWHSTQTPHRSRTALSRILGLNPDRLRIIAPDVGGAFGMKSSIYPEEVLAVWSALHLKRSVLWIATRSEDFLSGTHGRGTLTHGRLGLTADGRFTALQARIDAPLGHWVPNSGLITGWNAARVLPSGYDIATVDIVTKVSLTDAPPRGIYRGAGRPEANMLMERLIAKASEASGLDPLLLRRRNLVSRRAMPHRTATGNLLDSGCYRAALDRIAGRYKDACTWRDSRRAQGHLAGVGLAFYVEPSGEGWESAQVMLGPDGKVDIASGSSKQGQARASAYARIAAQVLNVPLSRVSVRCGDTATCPEGIGALASRSTAIGASAVLTACHELNQRQTAGETPPITVDTRYETRGQAWGYGIYLCRIEIDQDTGKPDVVGLHCLDDAGRAVLPWAIEGQIRGGVAQGIGEALFERLVFDEAGQLLTGSLMDYALPRASDMPPVTIEKMETPSPLNALGAKGVGEAGTIGAPPAILNAALDALAPLGVRDLTMPLTPCAVWTAMQTARKDTE